MNFGQEAYEELEFHLVKIIPQPPQSKVDKEAQIL